MKGLIYASGALVLGANPSVKGVLLAASLTKTPDPKSIHLAYDTIFIENPPPAFEAQRRMTIAAGSWKRIVN
ncbi:MAG: hypothetical protein D6788_12245 [Planctomycetota bacterium]|nr:MAG: hypothetical protein D6788_12245 [Planctomycetota bacterium]